jgi:hypothetical protein
MTGGRIRECIETQAYLAARQEWWNSGKWKDTQDEQARTIEKVEKV